MSISKRNFFLFAAVNFTLVSVPVFLAGCGGADTALAGTAVSPSSSSGSGSSTSSGSAGSSSSNGGSSGTSGSGTSGSGTSGSGTSGSGTSGSGSGTGGADAVPAGALSVTAIQKLSNWKAVYDTATGGSGATSSGQMSITDSPSLSGSARKFVTSYQDNGGERYWTSFGADTATTNFFYDGWLYIANSAASIANIELDMNQVMSNGQTVIYGFQCDGWSGTWDYTKNSGTPQQPKDGWVHSAAPCNPRKWKVNTWHHVQIAYSRDQYGNVTYQYVTLDGTKQTINATVPSAFALGWGSTLLTNFQIDGLGTSGTSTVYLDNLTISRW